MLDFDVFVADSGMSLYLNNFTGTVPQELCKVETLIEYCFPLICNCSTNCSNKCV